MARSPDPFLTDPDVDARRHELSLYFAPHPAPFLKDHDRMRAQTLARQAGARLTWGGAGVCWPAFFFGPVWFFYRRLYGVAWTIVAILVLVNVVGYVSTVSLDRLGLPFNMALAVIGRRAALHRAFRRLESLRRDTRVTDDAILKAGGVSRPVAWISGIVFGLIVILSVAGIVLGIVYDEKLPR